MFGVLSACAVKSQLIGSKWVVVGNIEIAPMKAGVFYQAGKPVAAISGDQYAPWCHLVFKDKVDKFRTIKSGSYEITKVVFYNEAVFSNQVTYKTRMTINSSEPVQIIQMTCGNWDDSSGSYLTHDQLQQTMHGVMKLEIAPQTK